MSKGHDRQKSAKTRPLSPHRHRAAAAKGEKQAPPVPRDQSEPAVLIHEAYLFVGIDVDGEERILGIPHEDGLKPLFTTDPGRVDKLRPLARQTGESLNISVHLIRLSSREKLEQVWPGPRLQ